MQVIQSSAVTYSQLHQDFRSTHRPSGEAFFLLQLDLPLTFTGRGKLPKATSRSYEKSYGDETAHLCKSLILLKKFFGLVESRPLRQLLLADPTKPLIFKGFFVATCPCLLPLSARALVAKTGSTWRPKCPSLSLCTDSATCGLCTRASTASKLNAPCAPQTSIWLPSGQCNCSKAS